ncbi:hypothetical protein CC86DRAFT_377217 [Ophiobolus disseminans]|uniref:Uncharacterized protein n=1 Tax=Ophiobolus disseminans TaxID=1469910 RepID=A0A6A7AHB3_9PLEO|nr:hypothetical protein CC86DRAFT_377217 [Ophiobolus disseminans]
MAYRDQVERLNRGGIDVVGKERFTYLYSPARERALTRRNIKAGWSATGLYPFNPNRVLKDIPKPSAEVVVLGIAITSTDTHMPDETKMHIQKLANAAQISFAERVLLKDRNRFLFKINNVAKARRSTRSIVLGKAKVTSFEDLEEAKARRAAKEEVALKKVYRSRKRKGSALEADADSSVDKGETVRVNEALQRR